MEAACQVVLVYTCVSVHICMAVLNQNYQMTTLVRRLKLHHGLTFSGKQLFILFFNVSLEGRIFHYLHVYPCWPMTQNI